MSAIEMIPRRTMHPYQVKNLGDLPGGLKSLVEQELHAGEVIGLIFVIPVQAAPKKFGGYGGLHRVPEQALVFTARGMLHVLKGETPQQPDQRTWIEPGNLLAARLSLVLLYGRLELHTASRLDPLVVEYNTVSHHLLRPALGDFLYQADQPVPSDKFGSAAAQVQVQVNSLPIKFQSGLQIYALHTQENVLGVVFQPRLMKSFGKLFYRVAAPASLLTLTDSRLILIEEGRTQATSYGWFITFCPRRTISGMEIRPAGAYHEVVVHQSMQGAVLTHTLTVQEDTARAWMSIWEKVQ